MSIKSEVDPSLKLFLEQKRKYRVIARNAPLSDRLRQLEALQGQSYEIMRIRELNGGKPISHGWQRWAQAQRDLVLIKK